MAWGRESWWLSLRGSRAVARDQAQANNAAEAALPQGPPRTARCNRKRRPKARPAGERVCGVSLVSLYWRWYAQSARCDIRPCAPATRSRLEITRTRALPAGDGTGLPLGPGPGAPRSDVGCDKIDAMPRRHDAPFARSGAGQDKAKSRGADGWLGATAPEMALLKPEQAAVPGELKTS